jgi:hypothetical protein
MIKSEMLTDEMVHDLSMQIQARFERGTETVADRLLYRDCQGALGIYCSESNDKQGARRRICDHLNTITRSASELDPASHYDARKEIREDRQRAMFGCTSVAIDEALGGMSPRDIVIYAMGTLSNAQELMAVTDHDADTIRRLLNIAKYAIDKAVPR